MILVTADIHIHNYRNYNLFSDPLFRLNQFEKLANRLVEAIQVYEVSDIVICGDLLHVSSPRPIVVKAVFNFLEIISRISKVHVVCGNHDMDSRSYIGEQHTLLSICEHIPNVFYRDDVIVDINGKKCYFLGYRDNWVECIKEKLKKSVDILFGHVMPYNVKIGQSDLTLTAGEDLSKIPASIAFVGDIHRHQILHDGKVVVPGCLIQHSFNDHSNTGFILLDEKKLTWKHHPTEIKGWEFLKFVYSDKEVNDPYTISRPKTSTKIAVLQNKAESEIDTLAIIQRTVKEAGLENLHTELLGSVSKDVRNDIDLNFVIENIKIKNFRSISDFEWNNVNEGVKLISGLNGTGKSSLVNAIMFVLTGRGSARNLTQNKKKNMLVEVTFIYEQLRHTIRRGWTTNGKLQYFINKEEIPAENQRALLQKINENLPFLNFSDLFYHEQDRPGFLASYNYTSRVDLISRVLGLKIVDELQQAALERIHSVDKELISLREKLAASTSIVEQESLVDFSIMEIVDEATEKNLLQLKEDIKKLLDKERATYTKTNTEETSLVGNIKRATSLITQTETWRQEVNEKRCYTCGQRISGEEFRKVSEEIDEELSSFKKELNEDETRLLEIRKTITPLSNSIIKLENKYNGIVAKLSELSFQKDQAKKLESLKNSINKAKKECILIDKKMENILAMKESLDIYQQLMGVDGPVMRSILTSVSEILTSDTIRVRAHKQLVNGEIRPDFGVDMKIPGQGWITYDELSGGQKTVSDITILEKLIRLVGGVGLLIFDETFKYLDLDNLEKIVELIKSMRCHSTFIVSHAEGFPFYDTLIQTTVDKSGHTLYTVR